MSHLENTYPMASTDGGQYGQQRQPGTWHPNLIPTHSQGPNFAAPGPAGSDPTQHYQFYPQAADTRPNIAISASDHLGGRSPSSQLSLNLNLSSLSVASPSHASPINPSPSSCLSHATPISPAGNPFSSQSHQFHFDAPQQTQAQASAGTTAQTGSSPTIRQYDEHGMVNSPTPSPYDAGSHNANAPTPGTGGVGSSARRTPGPSRSSSTSSLSQPTQRDRGFSNPSSTTTLVEEETMYDDGGDAAMDLGGDSGYDDMDSMRNSFGTGTGGNGGSPVNGNGSNSGAEDAMGNSTPSAGANLTNGNQLTMNTGGVGGSMGVLGKPIATNNFVTKLFQMINDPKSAHYISWTELGTSFVVSNVGEFSRSILGSHFKHNNFSSFVRQLNMYGFHKINRTPRAQRTSTDAQTWEFSHTKFLRGRPDLLDEIKRKALEPDPAIKHRVELPGEVAAQLGSMREENKRLWEELQAERKHREKLSQALSSLWKGLANRIPDLPMLPPDLTDMDPTSASGSGITSPSASGSNSTITTPGRFQPPPLTMNIGMHNMSTISSPAASPTTTDFPENNPLHHQLAHHHQHQMSHQNSPSFAQHPHQHQIVGAPGNITLSRHNSFQHMPGYMGGVASSPSPSASGPMDMFDDSMSGHDGARVGSKRQRLSDDEPIGTPGGSSLSSPVTSVPPGGGLAGGMPGVVNTGLGGIPNKKMSRARSDSAPLGYGFGNPGLAGWGGAAGVGTGVVGRPRSGSGLAGRGIPSYGGMNRNFIGTPGGSMLSGGSNGGSGTGTPLSGIPMNAPSR